MSSRSGDPVVHLRAAVCLLGRFPALAGIDLDVGAGEGIRDVQVARLSAGQRRRASLAAFLVRDATLWLLDEPHAGLDAVGRDLLDDLVRDAAARGTTVVLASHELERATPLVHRE